MITQITLFLFFSAILQPINIYVTYFVITETWERDTGHKIYSVKSLWQPNCMLEYLNTSKSSLPLKGLPPGQEWPPAHSQTMPLVILQDNF